ncbi:MAG TPA: TIGR02147 family protein [Polyangiales bacterium]|nr:TIGR02147 family protein [Polyangiales bacterium]
MTGEVSALRRCPIDVFRYLDYRSFLADFYAAKKRRGFSYRAFSRSARLGAPNYLKLVITGKRNLTAQMAERFASSCGLRGDAAAYFQNLVEFNQATTAAERNASYRQLSRFRRYRDAHKLERAHAAYHSTWYLPAIRELCASPSFREDPAWLASVLRPPIKTSEAKHALELLLELGLLVRTADGRLQQNEPVVTTGPETRHMNIRNYHTEMLRRAIDAIEVVPAKERDISSLTLCLGPEGLARFKQRIAEFQQELIDLAEHEAERSQAVQVNFQLFPLSNVIGPKEKRDA